MSHSAPELLAVSLWADTQFLSALAEEGVVAIAARRAGISPLSVWRRCEKDLSFRRAFDAAWERGRRRMEARAARQVANYMRRHSGQA